MTITDLKSDRIISRMVTLDLQTIPMTKPEKLEENRPKKCLAESPEHEPDDLKAASMKYAEAIRAQFDEPSQAKSTSSSSSKKKSKTNKRKAGPEDTSTSNNKTPRLVIKFSKDSSTSGGNADKIR